MNLYLKASESTKDTAWGIFVKGDGEFPIVVLPSLEKAREAYLLLNKEQEPAGFHRVLQELVQHS